MLSKKMTFSLMSLITLLAFAFVVSSAMAADPVVVTIEGRTAVSHAVGTDGTTPAVTMIPLKVTTDQPVAIGSIDTNTTAGQIQHLWLSPPTRCFLA